MVLEAWRSFARATMAVLREAWMVVRMLLLQNCCSTQRGARKATAALGRFFDF